MWRSIKPIAVAGASAGAVAAYCLDLNSFSQVCNQDKLLPSKPFLRVAHAVSSSDYASSGSAGQKAPSAAPAFSHELPIDFLFGQDQPCPANYGKWDDNWDKRDPEYIRAQLNSRRESSDGEREVTKPTASRRLILIRHGQYNTSARTDVERVLTELGHEQANASATHLHGLLSNTEPSLLIHSTMTRAVQTFQPFQQQFSTVDKKSCDLLREGAPYPPDPPSKTYRPLYHFYTDGARIEAGFRHYFHRADVDQKSDSVEIIVCHANVIRYFVCRALQLPPSAWLRISLAHCSLTVLDIRPSGRVSLRALGDTGHLPRNLVTYH